MLLFKRSPIFAWIGVSLLLILLSFPCALPSAAQSLRAGSVAPALPPLVYLKGQPLYGFEPGHVYVIEFWATWCSPCRHSIPHLTQLQHKYPAVRMIGISAWDNHRSNVTQFVNGMGDQMAYTVAFDADRSTDRLYMKPAGGVPKLSR